MPSTPATKVQRTDIPAGVTSAAGGLTSTAAAMPRGAVRAEVGKGPSVLAQHHIVRREVKTIAILAGSVFLIIIILSFILPAVGL